MKRPEFDEKGQDSKTYSPFRLYNCLDTQYRDVRLAFYDWGWLHDRYGADTIDGYYMNGYGVEGLVKAALFAAGIDPDSEGVHCNSEGDTCNIHFKDLNMAVRTAELASAMIADREKLGETIRIAREQGFED
jgi:hypothetical protein